MDCQSAIPSNTSNPILRRYRHSLHRQKRVGVSLMDVLARIDKFHPCKSGEKKRMMKLLLLLLLPLLLPRRRLLLLVLVAQKARTASASAAPVLVVVMTAVPFWGSPHKESTAIKIPFVAGSLTGLRLCLCRVLIGGRRRWHY